MTEITRRSFVSTLARATVAGGGFGAISGAVDNADAPERKPEEKTAHIATRAAVGAGTVAAVGGTVAVAKSFVEAATRPEMTQEDVEKQKDRKMKLR